MILLDYSINCNDFLCIATSKYCAKRISGVGMTLAYKKHVIRFPRFAQQDFTPVNYSCD